MPEPKIGAAPAPAAEAAPQPDQEAGAENIEGGVEQKESEAGLQEYEQAADQMEDLTELVSAKIEDMEATKAELAAIRAKMGITNPDDAPLADREAELQAVQARAEQLGASMAALESKALGLPEEPINGEPQEDSLDVLKKVEELQKDLDAAAKGEQEKSAEEQRKWREEEVQAFIKTATEKVLKYFESMIGECENSEEVMNYIPVKIESWVNVVDKKFIEDGTVVNDGFMSTLEIKKHQGEDGNEVQYVTAFKIDFIDKKEADKVDQDDAEDEEEMLKKDDATDLAAAEKQGDVEAEEAK